MRQELAQLGRMVLGHFGALRPNRKALGHKVFCFFATPDIGGAERIHAQIVAAIADAEPLVFFTEQPRNNGLLPAYERNATVVQLAPKGRRRVREYLHAGSIAAAINRADRPVVFGAFSHFFYQLLPRLKDHVRAVDLTHNFGIGFENFSLRHVPRLDARVVIADYFREQYEILYDAFGLEEQAARMRVISNAVHVPGVVPEKPQGPLQVLYVGRDSPEKRVALVGAVSEHVPEAEFTLIGVEDSALEPQDRERCRCLGVITDAAEIAGHYERSHVLLLTSEREGLPVTMLEGMARGVVPVVPAVGGIPEHMDGSRGVVVLPEPPELLVDSAAEAIKLLDKNRRVLTIMGKAAHAYARERFALSGFVREWRKVLLEERL